MSGPAARMFIVAGEQSGDVLGAGLVASMRQQLGGRLSVEGVGGPGLAAEGLASLFPMADLAVMGIGPVLARLPLILRRIRETAAAAIAARPDVIVLIDSPDFTHRVARRVRAALPDVPIVVYVSPTVWFWRPGRAAKLARFCTRLLALLPFEPEVHRRLGGPETIFVGHSFVDKLRQSASRVTGVVGPGETPRVVVLPGSRRSEVARLTQDFGGALQIIGSRLGPLDVTIPVVDHVRPLVEAAVALWPVRPKLVFGEAAKLEAFATAHAALAASGTATLELALSGVPTVAAYRLDWIGRRVKHFIRTPEAVKGLLHVRTAQLANVILDDYIIPEFIDDDCTPAALAATLQPLLTDPDARGRQTAAFGRLASIMRPDPSVSPADRAATAVIETLRGGRLAAP